MSGTRYSSGQNIVDNEDDAVGEVSCACAISFLGDLADRRRKKDRTLSPLDSLVASLSTLLDPAAASHVLRGWPRKPWINTMLKDVSNLATYFNKIILEAELIVVLRAGC
jgi:hypothetical protein